MADWITDKGTLIYENSLAREEDLRDFRLEGRAKITFPAGRMLLENAESADLGQKANYVLWCEFCCRFPSVRCGSRDWP